LRIILSKRSKIHVEPNLQCHQYRSCILSR
jgi:hypothetical protein